jgi:membrane protein implicated in regulation of membrane protease activity
MIGRRAVVADGAAAGGRLAVMVAGERWNARASVPLAAGDAVEVAALDGLTLVVRPVSQPVEPES